MKKNNKKAFTLVELLVVIAIIAILAVVSVVGYTAFTGKARESVAQQELSQVVNMIIAEDTANGDTFDIDSTDGLKFKESQESNKTDYKITHILTGTDYAADLAQIKGTFSFTWGESDKANTVITSITYTKDGYTSTYNFASKTYTNAKAAA